MRDYSFIKLRLVRNDISNIPGKKRLLFLEGSGYEVRRGVAFSHVQNKSLVPGLSLGVAGRRGGRGGEEVVPTGDTGYNRPF